MVPPPIPLEVISLIIEQFIPSSSIIALPQNHPTTRTLHALTSTSKAIYPIARRLLLTHCLYINSKSRVDSLLSSLKSRVKFDYGTLHSIYLSSTTLVIPGSDFYGAHEQKDYEIPELLKLLAPTLKRLVIDIPLESVAPSENQSSALALLVEAFEALTRIEIFYSLHESLLVPKAPLDSGGLLRRPLWGCWPQLRTLVLNGSDIQSARAVQGDLQDWRNMEELKSLETIILINGELKNSPAFLFPKPQSHQKLHFVVVNIEKENSSLEINQSEGVEQRIINVPTSYYGDDDPKELCKAWVKRRILRGDPVEEWE